MPISPPTMTLKRSQSLVSQMGNVMIEDEEEKGTPKSKGIGPSLDQLPSKRGPTAVKKPDVEWYSTPKRDIKISGSTFE